MAEQTENQEPSMEEILASIRRIISEDGATVQPAPPSEDAPASEPAPVLDLVNEVKDDGSVAEVAAPVIEMEEAPPMPEPEPAPVVAPPSPPPLPAATIRLDEGMLISETTAQASASVLGNLSRLKQSGGNATITSFPIGDGSRTLESMVLEIIRPQLKEWLDSNLPTLVEKIVQKEIQKITRDLG